MRVDSRRQLGFPEETVLRLQDSYGPLRGDCTLGNKNQGGTQALAGKY